MDKKYIEIILIAIGLIVSTSLFAWSIHSFNLQLDLQRNAVINEHISDMKSLELELQQNVNLMEDMINRRDFFIERTFHGQLVLENLRRSVSDGKISISN